MNPYAYQASLYRWDFFVTLTYRSRDAAGNLLRVPPDGERKKMLYAFLHKVSKGKYRTRAGQRMHSVCWHKFVWLARAETGEQNGRHHFHLLIGGLPPERCNESEAWAIKTMWSDLGGGFSDVRAYESRLPGVAYVMKGLDQWTHQGANAYELRKFDDSKQDRELILSDSFIQLAINGERKWAKEFQRARASGGTGTADISGRSLSARRKTGNPRRIKETPEQLEARIRSNWLNAHPAGVSFVR